jgi:hypothetical protein
MRPLTPHPSPITLSRPHRTEAGARRRLKTNASGSSGRNAIKACKGLCAVLAVLLYAAAWRAVLAAADRDAQLYRAGSLSRPMQLLPDGAPEVRNRIAAQRRGSDPSIARALRKMRSSGSGAFSSREANP